MPAGDCKTAWSQVGGTSQWTTAGSNIHFNTGSVGLGTTTPSDVLHALKSQNGATTVRVDNPDAAGNAAYSGIRFYQGGTLRGQLTSINDGFASGLGGPGALQLWNPLNANLVFGTNGAERIRIQGNGDVGVGTNVPGYRFAVEKTSSVINGEHFLANFRTGSLGADSQLLLGYRADGTAVTGAALIRTVNKPLFFGTSSANTAMTIIDSGNVGIGNTSPTEKLEITGNLKVTGTGNITATGNVTRKPHRWKPHRHWKPHHWNPHRFWKHHHHCKHQRHGDNHGRNNQREISGCGRVGRVFTESTGRARLWCWTTRSPIR